MASVYLLHHGSDQYTDSGWEKQKTDPDLLRKGRNTSFKKKSTENVHSYRKMKVENGLVH